MVIFNDFYHFFVTLKNGVFLRILMVFKWLKLANVRPFLCQKRPYNPNICNGKTIKICPNQFADFLRFLFTEDSLKIKKGLELVSRPHFP